MDDAKEQSSADDDRGQAGDHQGRAPRLPPAQGPGAAVSATGPAAAGAGRACRGLSGGAGAGADGTAAGGAAADLRSVGASTAVNGVVAIW